MKTRRSIALSLQNSDYSSLSMQSVLFPDLQKRDQNNIVPETPGKYNAVSSIASTVTVSVLETPDPEDIALKVMRNKKIISRTQKTPTLNISDELSDLDTTPDFNLQKKKGVISILESEFALNSSLKTNKLKNSYMIPCHDQKNLIKKNEADVIFDKKLSLDLNDNNIPAKQIIKSLISIKKTTKNLMVEVSSPSYIKGKREIGTNELSIESSFNSPKCLQLKWSKRSMLLRKKSVNLNDSTIIYENNDLDFTNPSSGSNVILNKSSNNHIEPPELLIGKEKLLIPKLNLSSSFCYSNQNVESHIIQSICNFSNNLSKQSEDEIQDKIICTAMTNYNTNLEELNQSIFLSQNLISSTQPACCLILQGITALVDVRSGAENRSLPIEEVLQSLGAKVVHKILTEVSHLIFRNGSRSTYQLALNRGIHIVSSLWVDACKVKEVRVSESLFPICTEYTKHSRVKRPRKLKSMQPRTFEEDKQLVESRLKKRLQIENAKASSSSDIISPVISNTQKLISKQVDSPLFGVEHLLTPNHFMNSLSSQSSTDVDDSDKEYRTPLAKRMYNRLMSPQRDLCSPIRKIFEHPPLSPLVCNFNESIIMPGNDSSTLYDPFSSSDKSVTEKPALLRRSTRLRVSKLPLYSSNKEFEMMSKSCCSKYPDTVDGEPLTNQIYTSENNLYTKKLVKINQSNIYCMKKSSLKDNDNCNFSKKNVSKQLCVTYSDLSEPSIKVLEEQQSDMPSTNSSQVSQSTSCSSKKHKLHTVDSIMSQDLIMPSTPEKLTNCIYDNLVIQESNTQRKEMKIHCRKDYANLNALPLPRKRKRTCFVSLESVSSNGEPVTIEKKNHEKEINLKTPKSRFSLIPKQRNSLEEFVNPGFKKRFCFDVKSNSKKSKPSICITSIHSSDMGSMHAIIKSLGEFKVVDEVKKGTTHIVCGSERRTMNVLFGIANGCWILDISWLYESVELLKWAPEEPFELFNFCPGSQITRLKKENGMLAPLFDDIGRIYINNCSPKMYVMKDLLLRCGAKICSTLWSADLIISNEKVENVSCAQVTEKWAFDSIQHWQVKQFIHYKFTISNDV